MTVLAAQTLLTNADNEHAPDPTNPVAMADRDRLQLVSVMVGLNRDSAVARLSGPAFVRVGGVAS